MQMGRTKNRRKTHSAPFGMHFLQCPLPAGEVADALLLAAQGRWHDRCVIDGWRPEPAATTVMKTHHSSARGKLAAPGKIGWILLWLIGVPIPVLLVLFLLRGCT